MKFLISEQQLDAIASELKLEIRWPDHGPGMSWKTDSGREVALVESTEQLGGYIGVSRGIDGYHIGTPKFAESKKLIALCHKLNFVEAD